MKLQLSTIAISIVVLASLLIDFDLKNWEKRDRVIEWDIHWYYAYLPAQFIYHDIKLEKSDYQFGTNYYLFWPVYTPDGKKIIKTTMGMSLLYAPFFFVAHAFANMSNYPENGFSEPYKLFLLLSAVFYLVVGLDYLKKVLQHFKFSDNTIAITILLIGLGTNLLAYSSQSAPMPHVYNFCLFAIFIYYTIKWYERQSIKNSLIIGALAGLITLIRPSNAIILIFFILYGVGSFSDLKQRALLFKQKILQILFMLVPFLLIWTPQVIYWKTVTGNYIYYSYNDEGFFFSHPHILDGLFSFRKGWLLYTPMMSFALIGIFLLNDSLKKLRLPIILFFIINVYIILSWWCWWYGGTYGQRSMIESYALLAIPFASFIKFVSIKKWYYRTLFYSVALFLIWLNIFQTYQFENFSLHWDGMTKDLYFKQFGKYDKIKDFDSYVKPPNYDEAKKGNSCELISVNKIIPAAIPISNKDQKIELIDLKAINGKYVCADRALNNIVVANRNDGWQWETFSLLSLNNGKYAIRTSDNHYLCSELNHENEITATRESIGPWETFTIIYLDSNLVAFKASNDKYISLDPKSLRLFANSNSISDQEKFMVINK